MARAFLDTNILVYADDADAGPKRAKAQALVLGALANGDAVISTQVLQEYFAVATRKLSVAADAAQKKVEVLAALVAVTIDPTTSSKASSYTGSTASASGTLSSSTPRAGPAAIV
jgi:predicted nucleic acid-binding protein